MRRARNAGQRDRWHTELRLVMSDAARRCVLERCEAIGHAGRADGRIGAGKKRRGYCNLVRRLGGVQCGQEWWGCASSPLVPLLFSRPLLRQKLSLSYNHP